jgi:hypothetical protein
MDKFKESFLQNYKNFSVFSKYLTFGKLRTNVDLSFTWYCAFTKQKKTSKEPQLEVVSSLFNYAVAQMRQACFMDLSGDNTKQAKMYFEESAWVFEHLMTVVGTLPPGEITVDLSKESLTMCSNLCLAQAQYLFFKKARESGMKGATLAKICAQIAVYFQKAYEACMVNQALKTFENGTFAAILGYHAKFYSGVAFHKLAEDQVKFVEQNYKDSGKAVTMLQNAINKYAEAQELANICGGSYKANFDKVFAECKAEHAKMEKDRKTVMMEALAKPDEVPKPDAQNFCKTVSVLERLNAQNPLENQFRHLVPPAVR